MKRKSETIISIAILLVLNKLNFCQLYLLDNFKSISWGGPDTIIAKTISLNKIKSITVWECQKDSIWLRATKDEFDENGYLKNTILFNKDSSVNTEFSYTIEREYDSQNRLIYYVIPIYWGEWVYSFNNIDYDNSNRIIKFASIHKGDSKWTEKQEKSTFEYNSNGNLLGKSILINNQESNIIYKYDYKFDKNIIVQEKEIRITKYENDPVSYYDTSVTNYTRKYDKQNRIKFIKTEWIYNSKKNSEGIDYFDEMGRISKKSSTVNITGPENKYHSSSEYHYFNDSVVVSNKVDDKIFSVSIFNKLGLILETRNFGENIDIIMSRFEYEYY